MEHSLANREGLEDSKGLNDFSPSHQKVFFDYLKAVADYEEFGTGRQKMVRALEEAETNGLFSCVQTRLPWVTDVFLQGILAGEEARVAAVREFLKRCAESLGSSSDAKYALDIDRARTILYNARDRKSDEGAALNTVRSVLDDALGNLAEHLAAVAEDAGGKTGRRGKAFNDRLSLVRWCLKYLPPEERDRRWPAVRAALGKVKSVPGICKKCGFAIDMFCGKYETLPIAAGMEDAYSALRKVSLGMKKPKEGFAWNKSLFDEVDFACCAELEKTLNRCVWRCASGEAAELHRAYEVICNANNARDVLGLSVISDDLKGRIANGIVGMEILWALSYSASRRLNARGSGKIPAMRLKGRIGPDGRRYEDSQYALNSVGQALDAMVMEAISRMLVARDVSGVEIVTHAVFREYREGEFDDKYLTAIVDNAIANRKHAYVCPETGPRIVVISGDEVSGQDDDGESGRSIFDTIIGVAKESPRDYAWFALDVVKKHTPKLWNYMRLVEWGISASDIKQMQKGGLKEFAEKYDPGDKVQKSDALKIVGATTTHLVEREREALLKALETQRGADYEVLVGRLKNVLKVKNGLKRKRGAK